MKGGMEFIRKTWNVPAKRGRVVRYFPFSSADDYYWIGVIASAKNDRLMVRYDWMGGASTHAHHPTWQLQYMSDDGTTVIRDTRQGSEPL